MEDIPGNPLDIAIRMADTRRIAAIEAIRGQPANLEETIGSLYFLTVDAASWNWGVKMLRLAEIGPER